MTTHELITANNLPDRLVSDIASARERVHLRTMDFDVGGRMQRICQAMLEAAERGVCVDLGFDQRSLRQLTGGGAYLGCRSLLPRLIRAWRKSYTPWTVADDTWHDGAIAYQTGPLRQYQLLRRRCQPLAE